MKRVMNVKRMMMASAVVLAMSMGLTSCKTEWKRINVMDDGPKLTESRPLKGFEEIEISGSPRVCYTQADSFSVRVKGTKTGIENILTDVDGKTLTIRNRGKISLVNISFSDDDALTVYVTSPDLTAIRLNGSGDFESDSRIDTDRLDIVLRGSGDIDVKDVICDRCEVELIGSGDINVTNMEAIETSASLVGSGDLNLGLMRVKDTWLSLKGSGDIEADFREDCGSLECELRGSGDITVKGSVRQFDSHKNGSGDIHIDRLNVK
jgi:hypothetical protein